MARPRRKRARDFPGVFKELRGVLSAGARGLRTQIDEPGEYGAFVLRGKPTPKYRDGMPFGGVQVRRSYVSLHPMPVCVFPDLLRRISPEPRPRMRGRSCFNFRALQAGLEDEMARLVRAGRGRFATAGYV